MNGKNTIPQDHKITFVTFKAIRIPVKEYIINVIVL